MDAGEDSCVGVESSRHVTRRAASAPGRLDSVLKQWRRPPGRSGLRGR